MHAPDDYLFAGGANKECGGYEENQMSLPRWQWLSIAHQENYDDTWTETPTQVRSLSLSLSLSARASQSS